MVGLLMLSSDNVPVLRGAAATALSKEILDFAPSVGHGFCGMRS